MSLVGGLVSIIDFAIRFIVLPDTGPGLVPKVGLIGPVLLGACDEIAGAGLEGTVLEGTVLEGTDLEGKDL